LQIGPWPAKTEEAAALAVPSRIPTISLAGGEDPGAEEQEGVGGYLGVPSARAGTAGGGGSTGAGSWQRLCAATAALRRREEGAAGLGRFRRSRGSSLGGSLGVRRAGERKERAAREREIDPV